MREFTRPEVVVSKCLGFAHCRWNGQTISDDFVALLEPFVTYHQVCPEVEIGLGVPRDPIRVVAQDDDLYLMQPATGADVSDRMRSFTQEFLDGLPAIDGFLLKSRSPSCGIKDVKVYPSTEKTGPIGKARGFFGGAVVERFPYLAIEDEGRLRNFTIREHFLTQLFALADFRTVKQAGAMGALVDFHTRNKYLLMAYNQQVLRRLGRIVANHEQRPAAQVLEDYERHLAEALARAPRFTAHINVLMHTMGYFSGQLTAQEKDLFLEYLEKYRAEHIPLSAAISVMRAWIVRFGDAYLMRQTYFEPYPEPLVEITDSGKGRSY